MTEYTDSGEPVDPFAAVDSIAAWFKRQWPESETMADALLIAVGDCIDAIREQEAEGIAVKIEAARDQMRPGKPWPAFSASERGALTAAARVARSGSGATEYPRTLTA